MAANASEQSRCIAREMNVKTATGGQDAVPNIPTAAQNYAVDEEERRLQDALNMIPDAEKAAYNEALERDPLLIDIESPPERFLRFDSFKDPMASAKRLIGYWEKRKSIFQDRAFLPLVQSGEGALTPEDVELLNSGFVMLVPEDQHGRAVLYHDRGRLTKPAFLDPQKRLRCFFYLLAAASENKSYVEKGIVLLSVYGEKTRAATFDEKTVSDLIDLFRSEVVPVRVQTFHLALLSARPVLDTVIPSTLQILEQKWTYLHRRTILHTKKQTEELLHDLQKYGLDAENLPKIPIGGRWTLGCFRLWLDDRIRLEKSTFGKKTTMMSLCEDKPIDSCEDEVSEDELKRKRRRADAIYARRKRARKKIELEVMEDQIKRLKRQQADLKKTCKLLEDQLIKARKIVELAKKGEPIPYESFMSSFSKEQRIEVLPSCSENSKDGKTERSSHPVSIDSEETNIANPVNGEMIQENSALQIMHQVQQQALIEQLSNCLQQSQTVLQPPSQLSSGALLPSTLQALLLAASASRQQPSGLIEPGVNLPPLLALSLALQLQSHSIFAPAAGVASQPLEELMLLQRLLGSATLPSREQE